MSLSPMSVFVGFIGSWNGHKYYLVNRFKLILKYVVRYIYLLEINYMYLKIIRKELKEF